MRTAWDLIRLPVAGLLAALLLLAVPSCAQRPYPLPGSDGPLPTDTLTGATTPIDVNTIVLLERVISIDEKANEYSAIWWVILTWPDPTAGATVAKATARFMQPEGNCSYTCDSGGLPSMGCCDGIWLPHIELLNLMLYDSDQQPRWRINANSTSGTVTWSTRLVGTWYAPLDYRAYPFDHQHMLLELAIADSQSTVAALKWDHVAKLNNTAHTKGPDVSGWRMVWGKGKIYDSRECFRTANVTQPRYVPASGAAADGTLPAAYRSVGLPQRYVADNRGKGTTEPHNCGTYPRYDEARALYGPIVLVADVMMKRVASYYVLTNLIPVLLITLVAFVVFFMPQDALGDRMSVVLTMLLSLTAMQFVFDFPPANYLNALQMVVLVSYFMIAIACVESLVVNRIATVADAISIKRTCMSKYSALLTMAPFERTLVRELLGKSAHGRPLYGASMLKPRPAIKTRHASGGPKVAMPTMDAVREDSALDPHVTVTIDSRAERPLEQPQAAAAGATPSLNHRSGHSGRLGSRRVPPPASNAGSASGDAAAIVAGGDAEAPEIMAAGAAGPGAGAQNGTAAPHSLVASPFASARTATVSFAGPLERQPTGDARSVVSTTASTTVASLTAGCAAIFRRCCMVGLGPSLRALLTATAAWVVAVVTAPSRYYRQAKEDGRFARYVAGRIDKWSCIVCVTLYAICITVLLWIEVKVGDHKLMLGDAPGNM
ncbi:hypothetical protein GPECTOR_14g172 [Gonium pectorale]|uniref:Uncharacterized protein n=1 Tax=Gonium pectorale TaxID=33097 RepID=A0A150GM36_GONPE|nr:hypothetical protein GPECTOR_14g172 [Gonium pectorale]|eukprot:KXZ50926.1 hypothetical protein GPECTOR_14g172 [Gonium pectorale]